MERGYFGGIYALWVIIGTGLTTFYTGLWRVEQNFGCTNLMLSDKNTLNIVRLSGS